MMSCKKNPCLSRSLAVAALLATIISSSVQARDVEITACLNDDSTTVQVTLREHSVRSPDGFVVFVQGAGGKLSEYEPGPSRLYRGWISDEGGARLGPIVGLVSRDSTAMRALTVVNGDEYELMFAKEHRTAEWNWDSTKGTTSVETTDECVLPRTVPVIVLPDTPDFQNNPEDLHCAELAIDTDVEFRSRFDSTEATLDHIELMIALINIQYEEQVKIRHVLSAVIIREAEPDPYGPDGNLLLIQLMLEWINNQSHIQRDLVMLLKFQNGQSVANIGSICTTSAYCVAGNGGSLSQFALSTPKHELGHVWGAVHCNCPGNTMAPSSGAGGFSQQSINSITNTRDSVDCLDICGTFETGTAPFPFSEIFEDSSLKPSHWTGWTQAAVASDAVSPPSEPFVLALANGGEIRSGHMDTSGNFGVDFQYHVRPRPGARTPLIVEYLTRAYLWEVADIIQPNEVSAERFTQREARAIEVIDHEEFRLRFRVPVGPNRGPDAAEWFVDDIILSPVVYNPCPSDCHFPRDGDVDIDDLLEVLITFQGTGEVHSCDAAPVFEDGSFGNGVVNIDDLLTVLTNFGPCD